MSNTIPCLKCGKRICPNRTELCLPCAQARPCGRSGCESPIQSQSAKRKYCPNHELEMKRRNQVERRNSAQGMAWGEREEA